MGRDHTGREVREDLGHVTSSGKDDWMLQVHDVGAQPPKCSAKVLKASQPPTSRYQGRHVDALGGDCRHQLAHVVNDPVDALRLIERQHGNADRSHTVQSNRRMAGLSKARSGSKHMAVPASTRVSRAPSDGVSTPATISPTGSSPNDPT